MKEKKLSTKKITYILVTVLSVIGITLAIPGIVSQAENNRADKGKTEIMEPFTGEKSDSVDENIMKSEMEWDPGSEAQEEKKEDEPADNGSDEEQTGTEEEPNAPEPEDPEMNYPETDDNQAGEQEQSHNGPNEEQLPSQDQPHPNDTPGAQDGEDNPPSESEDEHTHVFGEWITIVNPTCTDEGTKSRECSCGQKETSTVEATGHSWIEKTETISDPEGQDCICDGCGYNFGSNPTEEELNAHTMYDDTGNLRTEEEQARHSTFSRVTTITYYICEICGFER